MSIQTSSDYWSKQAYLGYTSPNLSLRSRPQKIEGHTIKRENHESSQGLLHNGFTQSKTIYALNNIDLQ